MKMRHYRMVKAWRLPLPTLQRFIATDPIYGMQVGDTFTLAGVFRVWRYLP